MTVNWVDLKACLKRLQFQEDFVSAVEHECPTLGVLKAIILDAERRQAEIEALRTANNRLQARVTQLENCADPNENCDNNNNEEIVESLKLKLKRFEAKLVASDRLVSKMKRKVHVKSEKNETQEPMQDGCEESEEKLEEGEEVLKTSSVKRHRHHRHRHGHRHRHRSSRKNNEKQEIVDENCQAGDFTTRPPSRETPLPPASFFSPAFGSTPSPPINFTMENNQQSVAQQAQIVRPTAPPGPPQLPLLIGLLQQQRAHFSGGAGFLRGPPPPPRQLATPSQAAFHHRQQAHLPNQQQRPYFYPPPPPMPPLFVPPRY